MTARMTNVPAPDFNESTTLADDALRRHLALKRELIQLQDHVVHIETRLARLQPLLQILSVLGIVPRLVVRAMLFPLKAVGWILRLPAMLKQIEKAKFQSERVTYDPASEAYARRLDRAAWRETLRRSFGFLHPPLYKVALRQRLALARRPRVLHAIANVFVGGSTQLVVDLHDYLGHRIEMEVLTSALPKRGSHHGMIIHLAPQPVLRYLVRGVFSRFRPDIVHVHYWGDVDEPWYRAIFDVAAEIGCPIVQNVNTPVAPFSGVPTACNVFVSQSVADRFGSQAPARVIHPGIDLERFTLPKPHDSDAFHSIGMIYRLENDKLNADAIELFITVVKMRPRTRVTIVGDGSLFGHFRSRVEQECLLPQFEFTGFVPYDQLQTYLARFKLFVAPVWQESFGQVIPFAMCAGLAVAGYRVGAVPEILGSDETLGQTLVETATIIVALLDDREKLEALGKRNRALAIERFSVETMAIAYLDLYRAIAPREFDIAPTLPDAISFPL